MVTCQEDMVTHQSLQAFQLYTALSRLHIAAKHI